MLEHPHGYNSGEGEIICVAHLVQPAWHVTPGSLEVGQPCAILCSLTQVEYKFQKITPNPLERI